MSKCKRSSKKDKTQDNQINYKKNDLAIAQNIIVNIPNNFFEKNEKHKDVLKNKVFI